MIRTIDWQTCLSREEWLEKRKSTIGGSDAGAILGVCPWKTSEELWEEKVGIVVPKDVSDNPLVKYGTMAEEHLRNLFVLDYPQYDMVYAPNNIYINSKYPFGHASLDAALVDRESGEHGILEIKTATIQSKAQKEKWQGNRIPQNYYAQVLFYMLITEASFAYLKAQLKYEIEAEEVLLHTKHYRIDRCDVEDELQYLEEKCREFDECVRTRTRPIVILPDI